MGADSGVGRVVDTVAVNTFIRPAASIAVQL